jgi:Transposase
MKTSDLCREHGISAATFYGWKQKFGGMDVSEAQHPGFGEPVTPFAPTRQALALVKGEARRGRHYRRFKRKLSRNRVLMKGVNALRQWTGAKPYSLAQE